MRIINIEESVFEAMLDRFEVFVRRVDVICGKNREKDKIKWLDNQDVCAILHISYRSLQHYRDNGTMPYTQIGRKVYYKPEDVERMLPVVAQKQNEQKLKHQRKKKK